MWFNQHYLLSNNRILVQPFTSRAVNASVRYDMLHSDDIGKEHVLAYVKPRFCGQIHTICSEKRPMKRKRLSVLDGPKKIRRKKEKTETTTLEVLASTLMRTEAGSPVTSLYGCQLSKYPELFCEKNGMPHKRTDKRGVREYVEKRYPQAISSIHNIHRSDLTIHDAMQYILTQPRTTDITWDDYFKLLWESKISPYFKKSNAVALIFDSQTTTNSVKTLLQENRDNNS